MSNFRFVSPLAASAIAVAVGLAGCVDENPWGNASTDKGTIDITLTADFGFDTQRPVFRSDGTRAQGDADDLSTYIKLPDVEEFRITLDSKDGKYHGSWESLSAFKSDVAAKKEFDAGIYTITASYGDASAQGFESPCFEASSTFTVIANRKSEVSLTAELVKSMVMVDYTDDFKAYMSDYKASLVAQGSSVSFSDAETRPAFISPGDAEITVNFTTRETKTANVNVGTFAAVAKTLHKLTFGVEENENGFAKLTVTFDDSLEDEELEVDLTEDLYTTPAPEIMAVGFENGATYDWNSRQTIDGNSLSGLKMNVVARGGISSATLGLVGAASPWGQETIDLHTATAATLGGYGVAASNFDSNDKPVMATLDVEGLVSRLAAGKGEFKIYLSVTDTYGQTCDPVAVIINSDDVAISLAKEGDVSLTPDVDYGAAQTAVILDYNGNDADGLTFQTADGAAVAVVSCESTRAFENSRYTYTLLLPEKASISDKVSLIARQNGVSVGSFEIPVKLPDYSISEVDAFAHYAYLKVDASPSVLGLITSNITLKSGNSDLVIANRDADNGILTVTNLSAGTTYNLKSSIINKEPTKTEAKSIATENELAIPNGDFENLTETINTTMNQGGKWTITEIGSKFQTTLSIVINEPTGWFSSNNTTCNINAGNINSWYVIPSVYNTTLTWESNQPDAKIMGIGQSAYKSTADIYKSLTAKSGNNAMVIRNVAWDGNGEDIKDNVQTGNSSHSNYYCSNKPSSIANRTAGYLKLGSASSEGASFSSRPTLLKGWFKYQPDNQDADEKGLISVKLLNGSEVIGSGSIELGSQNEYAEFSIPITYVTKTFGKKATSLQIAIYASNKTSGIKTTDYCNKEECCSRGSSLTVDNLTLEYK